MLLYEWNNHKQIPSQGCYEYPGRSADQIVGNKCLVVHAPNPSNKRGKCPHNRDKTREHDRFTAICSKKLLGFLDMHFVEWDFGVRNQSVTKKMTDPVVDSVTQNCGEHQEWQGQP